MEDSPLKQFISQLTLALFILLINLNETQAKCPTENCACIRSDNYRQVLIKVIDETGQFNSVKLLTGSSSETVELNNHVGKATSLFVPVQDKTSEPPHYFDFKVEAGNSTFRCIDTIAYIPGPEKEVLTISSLNIVIDRERRCLIQNLHHCDSKCYCWPHT